MQLLNGQQIDREAMCLFCGFSSNAFAQMLFRNQVALAFGVPVPSMDGVFIPADAIVMRLNGEIGMRIGRDYSTAILLSHWHIVADCIARAEAGDPDCMFFCVGIRYARDKQREADFIISGGTQQEITADFAGVQIDMAVTASVTGIIADIRARAKAAGLDLQRFLPPYGDPAYRAMIDQARQQRLEALRRYRGGKHHLKRKPVGKVARAAERLQ